MWLDGVLLVGGVLLPGFQPTARWRFGFGARSGPNYAMLEERHDVRLFRVALGARLGLGLGLGLVLRLGLGLGFQSGEGQALAPCSQVQAVHGAYTSVPFLHFLSS